MKIPLKFGLLIAVVIAFVNIIQIDLIGIENKFVRENSDIFPALVLAVGLFIGMRTIRKITYDNQINYGQTLFSGILITLYVALFLTILNMFYFGFVNTGYAERLINVYLPLYQQMKLSPEVIAIQVQGMRDTYSISGQFKETFIVVGLIGVVLSTVFSSILRTKDSFTEILKNKE